MADDKPIIIIKKKGGHGAHHGGAWKIAYADFVTAMMAFFMVMWLLATAESTTRKAIASYFKRPGMFESGSGVPLLIGASGILDDGVPPAEFKGESDREGTVGEPPKRTEKQAAGEELAEIIDLKIEELKELLKRINGNIDDKELKKAVEDFVEQAKEAQTEKQKMEELAKEIEGMLSASPELKELLGAVEVKIDSDGLIIEIMDTEKSSMFASGSSAVMPAAQIAMKKITEILNTMQNPLEIVGHTDAKPYRSRSGSYTNWELSADRANALVKF